MSHIERLTDAVKASGFDVYVYVNNKFVFGLDIRVQVGTLDGEPLWKNVGHAVFSPFGHENESVFVDGRIDGMRFDVVGRTPEKSVTDFINYLEACYANHA